MKNKVFKKAWSIFERFICYFALSVVVISQIANIFF